MTTIGTSIEVSVKQLIAGDDKQRELYSDSLDVLQTGLVDKLGIKHVAIAGHPETNSAYKRRDPLDIFRYKLNFFDHSDAKARITTQFGFDGPFFVE